MSKKSVVRCCFKRRASSPESQTRGLGLSFFYPKAATYPLSFLLLLSVPVFIFISTIASLIRLCYLFFSFFLYYIPLGMENWVSRELLLSADSFLPSKTYIAHFLFLSDICEINYFFDFFSSLRY